MQRTTMHFGAVLRGIVAVIALAALATGCTFPFEWAGAIPGSYEGSEDSEDEREEGQSGEEAETPADDPQRSVVRPIAVTGPSFTLAWDDDDSDTVSYKVYCRARGDSAWRLLADEIGEPSYVITTEGLPHGSYEFAVSSISAEGEESPLHESLDDEAEPEPWFLRWSA